MSGVRHATAALRRLLELLDGGAAADDLATVGASARSAGANRHELAEVDTAVEVALRIHRQLGEHHRRVAALTALFDTASDLAGLRDTDAVLRSIVHRARMLLRSDMAYLSLNDLDAELTYMRVTDGSASALFQRVVLGMGEGLGGLVAQTALPYVTADYAADARFNHTHSIDSAVLDEGLVAILGVPLRLENQVIGVLYAADRSGREFSADEVALLGSLADHAAIALESARLLEDATAALAELGTANETIGAHNEALRRATEAHDRLSDLVLRGGTAAEVAGALASVLHGGIVLHDADGAELARADAAPLRQPVDAVGASRSTGRAVLCDGQWVCAVLAGPELLGSIVLTGRAELADPERRLFERACVVAALLLMLRRSVAETEDRVRGELVSDLLSAPDRDPAGLLARGTRLGVDLQLPHAVAVAQAQDGDRGRLASLATAAAPDKALVGTHAGNVVLLVPADDAGTVASRTARDLTAALHSPVTVGAAGPACGPAGLAAAHAEAERCLQALQALGRHGQGAALAELGFLGVVLGDRSDVEGYVRATLGPVLDYDARRGTDLTGTLRAYFGCGGNLTRAKDELHVHVNTVTQRLERVSALLGDGWQQPERALELQLALRLHALAS